MVSGRLLDTLDEVGRTVRRCAGQPFGGIQVLLSGDFYQLPPPGHKAEGWAFEARCWADTVDVAVELTEVLRTEPQEAAFLRTLSQVRRGVVDDEAWSFLESLACKPRDGSCAVVEVVPTNAHADEINEAELSELARGAGGAGSSTAEGGGVVVFEARRLGTRSSSRSAFRAGAADAAPPRLRLCEGAVIVLTRGVRLGPRAVRVPNGSRCKIVGFTRMSPHLFEPQRAGYDPGVLSAEERAFLECHGGLLPRVGWLDGDEAAEGVLHPVRFDGGPCGEEAVQLPARLGWAITAHRAQGSTLGAAVVHLGIGLFSAGQAYVALSRCRRAADLWIAGMPKRSANGRVRAFEADPKVAAFYEGLGRPASHGAGPLGG